MTYTELHCHSYFSLLDGASSPEALVERAAALGMPALALTDHDAIYGAPAFARAAREAGIHAVFGAELTLHDRSHLTLLVENGVGWANLCALITAARHNADKGEALLPQGVLETYTDGLIALSGCRHHGRIARALLHGEREVALQDAHDLRNLFGAERFFIELQQHRLPDDRWLKRELIHLAQSVQLECVVTNNVHYVERDQHRLQDVLVSIRENSPLDHALNLRPNSEYYLKSAAELAPLFSDCPNALAISRRIAERCHFALGEGLQSLPLIPTLDGMSPDSYLRHLCSQRDLTEREQTQLEYELNVIRASRLSNYFLVVWDIVRFARENGILCQGRGSAANSLVAYRLGISPIHPFDHGLVFERFLSSERQVVPDIDMDFDAERREEVIQYVYQKYGHAGAAMACTFVTFRARSALRDAGKALGLPLDVLEHAASALDAYQSRDLGESSALREALGERLDNAIWSHALDIAEQLSGLPRHLGIHNGGMVISAAPLSERVPTEPATMADRYVVQWDKDGLEDAGMVKIDILGLRMLSVLADCAAIIHQHDDAAFRFEQLTFDDPSVYAMIRAADTIGVFQVESHAQIQVLPRLKPEKFNDLIVSISLIRPGPVQGNMVHPYLRRRAGTEPVNYLHPLLEAALSETLGVILFQEQVLKVARDAAGFTPGQGELLRRALGSKDPQAALERFQVPFLDGAAEKGIDAETAGTIFDKLRAFGGYSFPKSHAAAFAVIVYRSAWLKRYHPAAFAAALLNNQPMGFWSPAVIVNDAKRHDITVHGVDVNRSAARCTAEQNVIRLGLNLVNGMGKNAERIATARGDQPFVDLADFCRRVPLPRRLTEKLIQVGAMDSWGIPRRDLLWRLGEFTTDGDNPLALPLVNEAVVLPAPSVDETLGMEAGVIGFSAGAHPLSRQRNRLTRRGILTTSAMTGAADGARVRVAGLLVMHQAPPTAKGFHFLTLEDELGMISVIVRPQVYVRYRKIIRHAPLLVISGTVQHEGNVVNLLAQEVKAWRGIHVSSNKEFQSK